MQKRKFNYAMVKVVCEGTIKSCEFCKDIHDDGKIREGFCSKCGRPLDKKPGDSCNHIIAYLDKNYHQKNKVHIKCKLCCSVTTV